MQEKQFFEVTLFHWPALSNKPHFDYKFYENCLNFKFKKD